MIAERTSSGRERWFVRGAERWLGRVTMKWKRERLVLYMKREGGFYRKYRDDVYSFSREKDIYFDEEERETLVCIRKTAARHKRREGAEDCAGNESDPHSPKRVGSESLFGHFPTPEE